MRADNQGKAPDELGDEPVPHQVRGLGLQESVCLMKSGEIRSRIVLITGCGWGKGSVSSEFVHVVQSKPFSSSGYASDRMWAGWATKKVFQQGAEGSEG